MPEIEIRIKGCIDSSWSDWFGDLDIDQISPNETVLRGRLPDRAAVYGVISRLNSLGLTLISVNNEEHD